MRDFPIPLNLHIGQLIYFFVEGEILEHQVFTNPSKNDTLNRLN